MTEDARTAAAVLVSGGVVARRCLLQCDDSAVRFNNKIFAWFGVLQGCRLCEPLNSIRQAHWSFDNRTPRRVGNEGGSADEEGNSIPRRVTVAGGSMNHHLYGRTTFLGVVDRLRSLIVRFGHSPDSLGPARYYASPFLLPRTDIELMALRRAYILDDNRINMTAVTEEKLEDG